MNTIEIIARGICTGVALACLLAITEFLSTIKIELKTLNHYKAKEVEIMQARWNADKRKEHDIVAITSTLMQAVDNLNSSGPIDDDEE